MFSCCFSRSFIRFLELLHKQLILITSTHMACIPNKLGFVLFQRPVSSSIAHPNETSCKNWVVVLACSGLSFQFVRAGNFYLWGFHLTHIWLPLESGYGQPHSLLLHRRFGLTPTLDQIALNSYMSLVSWIANQGGRTYWCSHCVLTQQTTSAR